jgi:transposase-like protein
MAKIKIYDEEFRRNAIELLHFSQKPVSQVARE